MNQVKTFPKKKTLRGMTWNHTRGYVPMVATAQRFAEYHPDVSIVWEKRSLQEFADQPLDRLAETYDLLVMDHPWVGYAAQKQFLQPLDSLLPGDFLKDLATHAVGQSHASYCYDDAQWALAIDAAAPVSAYRPDLLERTGVTLPQTWEEVVALAHRGLVACPSIPLDVYGNLLNLAASAGAELFPDEDYILCEADCLAALEKLKQLADLISVRFLDLNPIRTLEVMAEEDAFAYCPYTYGYVNYTRPGYAKNRLCFGPAPIVSSEAKASTMLGGTGLALSARCQEPEIAAEYMRFVADPATQSGLFFQCGGQPGHRSAWLDKDINAVSADFFRDTLPTLDQAFVRPRYSGYLDFQDHAGDPIHAYLREGGEARAVLKELNALYRKTRHVHP